MRTIKPNDPLFEQWITGADRIVYNPFFPIRESEAPLLFTDGGSYLAGQEKETAPLWVYRRKEADEAAGKELSDILVSLLSRTPSLHVTSDERITGILDSVSQETGIPYALHMPMNAYACYEKPAAPFSGKILIPDFRHRDTVKELVRVMRREFDSAVLSDAETEEFAAYALTSERVFLLKEGHKIHSMANLAYSAGGYVRINTIVTAPDSRGKGYAGMLVAELSRRLLSQNRIPVIFADSRNPASNRAYQRIGFRREGEIREYRFYPEKKLWEEKQ